MITEPAPTAGLSPGAGSCVSSRPLRGLRPGACPQDVLEWKTSRTFLYWRLRRLLLEDQVKQEILQVSRELSHVHIQSMLRRWFVETEGAVKVGLGRRRGRWAVRALVRRGWACAAGGPSLRQPLPPPQAYLWDNNQMVVQWLEQHWQVGDGLRSTIGENIKYLKRDSVLKTIRR